MPHPDTADIIAQTKKWVTDVVVGCNFCPFAAKEVKKDSIYYEVLHDATIKNVLDAVMAAMHQLDADDSIETSLLILPGSFKSFDDYLQLLELSESLLAKENYEGIYQIAGFHQDYLFAGTTNDDPSNYTNRSPYPILHFLREDSVSIAVDSYAGIDEISPRNIAFTKLKGLLYMQQLLKQ